MSNNWQKMSNTEITMGKIQMAVVGGGAWGTAFAMHLAKIAAEVPLWVREETVAHDINTLHENKTFLPNIELPRNLFAHNCLNETILGADIVFWVVPSQHLRAVISNAAANETCIHVIMTKGIERNTNLFPYEIAQSFFDSSQICVLSGPSFAEDVAQSRPAILACASHNAEIASFVQKSVSTQKLRVYVNPDPLGVSLCGAYKNIIAVASGMCNGLGLGESASAATITRGIAELVRLSKALGAKSETVFGIAGLGDMVLTCTSDKSRNFSLGKLLSSGVLHADTIERTLHVAEGIYAVFGALHFAREHKIDLPIAQAVFEALWENAAPATIATQLMLRPLKSEW